MSKIYVDEITGFEGTETGAPITLSGDTATLGSGATLGSAVTFPAGMVISHQIKQNLAAGSSYTSTSFAEISSNLRITVTPKNSSSTLVLRVGLTGAISNNADLEIKYITIMLMEMHQILFLVIL